jgi:hypothetical protein
MGPYNFFYIEEKLKNIAEKSAEIESSMSAIQVEYLKKKIIQFDGFLEV